MPQNQLYQKCVVFGRINEPFLRNMKISGKICISGFPLETVKTNHLSKLFGTFNVILKNVNSTVSDTSIQWSSNLCGRKQTLN